MASRAPPGPRRVDHRAAAGHGPRPDLAQLVGRVPRRSVRRDPLHVGATGLEDVERGVGVAALDGLGQLAMAPP